MRGSWASPTFRRCFWTDRIRGGGDFGGKLFCDGRSPRQFERFAGVWSGGAAVHLWQGGFCLLAGGSFWFADLLVHGKHRITMTKVGGHTDAAAGRARDSRAGRRKSI